MNETVKTNFNPTQAEAKTAAEWKNRKPSKTRNNTAATNQKTSEPVVPAITQRYDPTQ